ncbi:hypothetical protein BGX24_004820 [Mortierella sp. AD032]|nr:hypothetical protein BGX24_004820 [Mortierella sp. AD032]
MKSAALILATLALAFTSEAARVTGTCYIEVVHRSDFVKLNCKATLPDGSKRNQAKARNGQHHKICAEDDIICWQVDTKSPASITVFYANQERQLTGSVSHLSETFIKSTWLNTFSADF